MRDELLGYLIGALEPDEVVRVEAALERQPELRRELELLDRSLNPVRADRVAFDPPRGLADRTCEFVFRSADEMDLISGARSAVRSAADSERTLAPAVPHGKANCWTISDMVIAAGIFLAASMLLFPAIDHSRHVARLTACRDNLRQAGLALTGYSSRHNGHFPEIATTGNTAVAGMYAPTLLADGMLSPGALVCPESQRAVRGLTTTFPTLDELNSARGEQLAQMQSTMGGSYGYNMGHMDASDHYRGTRNQGRSHFAIMSDQPPLELTLANHVGGQNVLAEDGSVRYIQGSRMIGSSDDIFHNNKGVVAAGLDANDSVIGASSAKPLLYPASR